MTEQEKRVNDCIENLELQIRWIEEIDAHKFQGWKMTVRTMQQAVGVLKAQDLEPIAVQKKPMEMVGMQTWYWACGNCGNQVLFRANYCSCCGRPVKWE